MASLLSYMAVVLELRTVLLGLLVFLLVSWIIRSYRKRVTNLPPGPMAWPLVGCIPQLAFMNLKMGNVNDVFVRLYEIYGPVCSIPLPFGKHVILASGYKAANEAFTNPKIAQRPHFSFKDNPVDVMNGSGMVMSTGEVWKEHRKFALTVFRSFGVGKRSFEDQIATETEYLMKEITLTQGKPFDPTHILSNAVSNIICSVVFGKRFEYNDPEFKHLLHSFEEIMNHNVFNLFLALAPKLTRYMTTIPFMPKGSFPSIISFRRQLQAIVNTHRETLDSENMRDYIDVYLNDMQTKKEQGTSTQFSDIELLAGVHDFFGAGTETTSTTLRWALLYMLKYPDVQKRVYEEIDSVVGRDRLPKLSDKPNLPYTVAVIHEVQRCASISFMGLPRYTDEDLSDFQVFTIPKGRYVQASLYSVSRDSSIWQDPDDFKPERFLDKRGQVIKIQENMVFGSGKRACLGEHLARMELFIFFTHLMHRYTFKKPAGITSVNIQPKVAGVLMPFPYDICAIDRI
ncbi:cytochrome P450 2J4-like [Amphiura filiformis]|uniref:cytochrome P450 2J4-like n=1 Tax=Amphiura filiformis TaxID=82378 RepID=UPI003B219874